MTRNLNEINQDTHEMGHVIYTIKRGDTLTDIAYRYGVSVESIAKLNDIKNPNLIFAGERLRINI